MTDMEISEGMLQRPNSSDFLYQTFETVSEFPQDIVKIETIRYVKIN
jgi:hypothetical protein